MRTFFIMILLAIATQVMAQEQSTRQIVESALASLTDEQRQEWQERVAVPPKLGERRTFTGRVAFVSGQGLSIDFINDEVEAVCYAVSAEAFVFAPPAYEAMANEVATLFPEIFRRTQDLWGPPEFDVDGVSAVYIVIYPFVVGPAAAGYVSQSNILPIREESNGGETIHLNPDRAAELGLARVLAHEYHHVLFLSHDMRDEIWLMEGLADLNMSLFGYEAHQGGTIDQFLEPWEGDPEQYASAFHFFRWLYNQYGFDMVKAIMSDPADGQESIAYVIGRPWEEVWSQYIQFGPTAAVARAWGQVKAQFKK